LPFRRERRWRTNNHDGIGAEAYQLCCKFIIRLGLALREPVFDREVLTLDIAKVAEPPAQRLNEVGLGGRREIAETRHLCWLLCPHHQRPRYRAAEEREELAPFYMTKLHPLPQARRQHNGLARLKSGGAAVRDFGPAFDRIGSIVCITAPQHFCTLHPR